MLILADTNIFIDLNNTHIVEEFFQYFTDVYAEEYCFISEMLRPEDLKDTLLNHGLKIIKATTEELMLAASTKEAVPRLSMQDCIAYAVTKSRGWTLVTGDKRLRKHAVANGVEVNGLIWIFQECLAKGCPKAVVKRAANIAMTHAKMKIPKQLIVEALPTLFEGTDSKLENE